MSGTSEAPPGPVIVLVGTSHPGNAGACARAAANFGATQLRFVAPRCDVLHNEAYERAVHAKPLLDQAAIVPDLRQALEGVAMSVGTTARESPAPNHFLRKPTDIRDWAQSLAGFGGSLAIVFGREDTGLTRDEVNLLDDLVTIPTADYQSLNLSHAVAVVGYELMRVRAATRSYERTLEPGALQALHRAWGALIDETEDRAWRREVADAVFRKMVGRSRPDTYEVHNIMGIMTRALKRFGHPDYASAKSDAFLREQGLLAPRRAGDEED